MSSRYEEEEEIRDSQVISGAFGMVCGFIFKAILCITVFAYVFHMVS